MPVIKVGDCFSELLVCSNLCSDSKSNTVLQRKLKKPTNNCNTTKANPNAAIISSGVILFIFRRVLRNVQLYDHTYVWHVQMLS